MINILIAARDTVGLPSSSTCIGAGRQLAFHQTTSALSSCIYCMAMYPNVQDRLRDLVGRSDVASQSGLKIPYCELA